MPGDNSISLETKINQNLDHESRRPYMIQRINTLDNLKNESDALHLQNYTLGKLLTEYKA